MKKMILLLAILTSVHFLAQAQTNTTRGSASVSVQKIEPADEVAVPNAFVHIDSLSGTASEETINLSLGKEFAEMEFDSWSMYHYMMANESAQYEAALSEPSARRKLSRRYSKVTHSIDSRSASPKD